MLEIKHGDLDVWKSGSLLIFEDDMIQFFITDDSDQQVSKNETAVLQIKFITDSSVEEPITNYEVKNGIGIITFTNYKDVTSTSIRKPLLIGAVNNRDLYIGYLITLYGSKTVNKKMDYTFYLGDKINE